MTFRQAAKATPAVAPHFKAGLEALRREHKDLIRISDPRRLDGSVDLDTSLRSSKPNDPRWDYGVGVRTRKEPARAIWIEVHPASSSHVEPVLKKLRWLTRWLEVEAPALRRLKRSFVWLASGRVALPPHHPKRRLLEQKGLLLKANSLNLDELN